MVTSSNMGGDSVTSGMFGEVFPWTPQASLLSSGNHHVDSKSKSEDLKANSGFFLCPYGFGENRELSPLFFKDCGKN